MPVALPLADDKPREECGVVGVYSPDDVGAARSVYWALSALQHRGQEAAGIASWQNGGVSVHKDTGLVASVFREQHLAELASEMAVGHVRYSTTGASHVENASPMVADGRRQVAVSHNGNLVDAMDLRRELIAEGYEFQSTSDSEILAALLARRGRSVWEALCEVIRDVRGAFSLVVLAEGRLYACRDPHGIRPLVLGMIAPGKRTEATRPQYVVASETCALDLLDAEYLRSVLPGEAIEISHGAMRSEQVVAPTPRGCVFEAIYFSRPDSQLGSETVYNTRIRLGKELAHDYPAQADMVIGVPNSGVPMAIGYADEAGLPNGVGLIKNDYISRTFIEPTPDERRMAVRKKLNPLAQSITGKRLVVVDDSLIRGTTLSIVVSQLREAGAAEVHLRIASPPARHPCFYGVDMGRPGEYIAEGRTAREVCEIVGADSLHYLTVEGLSRALRRPLNRRCTACFTGDYPIDPGDERKVSKDQFDRDTVGG